MESKKWNSLLASSANPEKLSRTVSGLAQFIPALLLVFAFAGVDSVKEADLQAIFSSVASAIPAMWAAIAAVQAVLGAVRKVYLKVKA